MALYNDHRPSDFKEIYGQDHIVKVIKKQIEDNVLPHCLIFYGPPGVGKTSLARIIANCYNNHKCGLKELDAAHDRKIDSIRDLIPSLYQNPLYGDYITVVFDEAHQITADAFQALQKIVEEPPEGVRFIFVTTRIDKIPSTIVDRSQRHSFKKIPNSIICKRIKEIYKLEKGLELSPDIIELIIQCSEGSLRRALVSLSQVISLIDGGSGYSDISESLGIIGGAKLADFIYTCISNQPLSTIIKKVEDFNSDKIDIYRAVYDLQQYLMELLVYLEDPETINYLKFNVKNFTDKIDNAALINSINILDMRNALKITLNKFYKISVETEELLYKSKNTSAIFKRMAVQLCNIGE